MSDQLLCRVAELEALLEHARTKLQEREEYIERLECRLEIDHYYVIDIETGEANTAFKKVIIPKDQRESAYDGIYCRDETIELQEEYIEILLSRIEKLKNQIAS